MSSDQNKQWILREILHWTSDFFQRKGIERGRFEAELLLAHVLQCERLDLYLNYDQPLVKAELLAFRALVAARGKREPLQYLLGSQEFWSLELAVSPAVLIPRQDSELLVTLALEKAEGYLKPDIIDLGTGSGALALALAHELPQAVIRAVDISFSALQIAKKNAYKLGLSVQFLRGNWLSAVQKQQFDLILSNPPYISTADLKTLMPEVAQYEPELALSGGLDGLSCYREIIPAAADCLKQQGSLLLEIGFNQAEAVTDLFDQSCHDWQVAVHQDYAGCDRVIVADLQ